MAGDGYGVGEPDYGEGEPDDYSDDDYGEGECTCRRTGRGGNDPEAGWQVDQWCPVHGRDPGIKGDCCEVSISETP